MGIPSFPWDNLPFASKGEVICGTVGCSNWLSTSLHQIGTTLYVPIAQAIYASLAANPKLNLLGSFIKDNAEVDAIRVIKTIHLPSPT